MTQEHDHLHAPGDDPTSPGYAAARAAGVDSIANLIHPITAAAINGQLHLGAHPSPQDPRRLNLGDFIDYAALPARPDNYDDSVRVNPWGMLNNDQEGDCVIAGLGHQDMHYSQLAGTPNRVTDEYCHNLYRQLSGGQDTGLVIQSTLSWIRKNNFAGRDVLGFAYVNPKDVELTKTAMFMFRNVLRGLMLPNTAKLQTGPGKTWAPTGPLTGDATPGSWGGHLTLDVAYTPLGVGTVTWGTVQSATWDFYNRYSMESWCIIPTYPIPGFKRDEFIQALKDIGSLEEFDDPLPNPPGPVPTDVTLTGATDAQFEAELVRRWGDLADIDIALRFRQGRVWTRGWKG